MTVTGPNMTSMVTMMTMAMTMAVITRVDDYYGENGDVDNDDYDKASFSREEEEEET